MQTLKKDCPVRRCILLAAAVCAALAYPLAVNARTDQPLAIRAAVSEATLQGSVVQGTMWLTVVNGGQTIAGLELKLVQPASGLLGTGTVEIGDVAQDETVVVSTAFRLEKASFDSPDPLTVEATFSEADGTEVKATLTVARNGGAR